jgi:hypothetical protein
VSTFALYRPSVIIPRVIAQPAGSTPRGFRAARAGKPRCHSLLPLVCKSMRNWLSACDIVSRKSGEDGPMSNIIGNPPRKEVSRDELGGNSQKSASAWHAASPQKLQRHRQVVAHQPLFYGHAKGAAGIAMVVLEQYLQRKLNDSRVALRRSDNSKRRGCSRPIRRGRSSPYSAH